MACLWLFHSMVQTRLTAEWNIHGWLDQLRLDWQVSLLAVRQVLVATTVDYGFYCGFFQVPTDALTASCSSTCRIMMGLEVIEFRKRLDCSQHKVQSYVQLQFSVTCSFHIFPGTCRSCWQLHCVNPTLSWAHQQMLFFLSHSSTEMILILSSSRVLNKLASLFQTIFSFHLPSLIWFKSTVFAIVLCKACFEASELLKSFCFFPSELPSSKFCLLWGGWAV